MENLYSVRIIRREDQAAEGEYIKQFWMFCGVYVREFILEYADEMRDDQEVDCNIYLTEENNNEIEMFENLLAKKQIYLNLKDENDLSGVKKRKEFGKLIKETLLCEIANPKDDIYTVYNAFKKNDMAYTNYLSHLYLNQLDLENNTNQSKKEKFKTSYKKCLDELYKSGEEFSGSVYKKFAYLNCCRKINRICKANREVIDFDVEAIVREAHKLNEIDKQFSMGNVLAGLAGLTEYETERDAERYLYNAVNQERGKKHSAFIYYCLGHYYEQDRHDWRMGWEQYQKMRNVVFPCNYRFYFKYACKEFKERNYENAYKTFSKIYNSLKIREEKGWIQLLELEYYYKCAKVLSSIPNKQEIVGIEIECVEKYQPDEILENCIKRNKVVDKFTGDRKSVQKYYKYKMEGHGIDNILGR